MNPQSQYIDDLGDLYQAPINQEILQMQIKLLHESVRRLRQFGQSNSVSNKIEKDGGRDMPSLNC